MADAHNALKFSPDLIAGLTKFSGMDETQEGVIRLGETLQPVLDPREDPEFAYLRREKLLGWTGSRVPGAGLNAILYLPNSSADVIVEVETVQGRTALATSGWRLGVIANIAAEVVGSTPITAGVCRDTRWRLGTGMFVGSLVWARNDQIGSGLAALATLATEQWYPSPIIIGPGAALAAYNLTVGEFFQLSAVYRERVAYPGELPRPS